MRMYFGSDIPETLLEALIYLVKTANFESKRVCDTIKKGWR